MSKQIIREIEKHIGPLSEKEKRMVTVEASHAEARFVSGMATALEVLRTEDAKEPANDE